MTKAQVSTGYSMDSAAFDKLVKTISTNKLASQVQQAGMAALALLSEHGQIGRVNQLYLAMPKGSKKDALAKWFLTFGKLEANTKDNKTEVPFLVTKQGVTDLEKAAATPWYDTIKSKTPDEIFDVKRAFEALLDRCAKAEKAGKLSDPALVKILRAAAPTAPAQASLV